MRIKQAQKFILLIAVFIFGSDQLAGQTVQEGGIRIIESTGEHIIFQVKIDSIFISEKTSRQQNYQQISISGFHFTSEPGKPQLPKTGMLMAIPPTGGVNSQIIESQITTRSGLTILPAAEQILDETKQNEPQLAMDNEFYQQDVWYPEHVVKISETGWIRDQRVAVVQLCPVQYNPAQRSLRIYTSLIVRLDFEGGNPRGVADPSAPAFENMLQKMLPNYELGKNWRAGKARQLERGESGSSLAAGTNYKIYVYEDGIYRLTSVDLEAAGISLTEIDPKTLRLFHRGIEQPIYVRGENDGRFDAGDYLEFYGQFHRGSDSYLSPYSDGNVYWLSWGEQAGRRLAETDAGLYSKNSNPLVSPTAFQFTQHIEEDKQFDRLLLVTDEKQDHWFWESMNALRSYEYKFHLFHPTSTDMAHVKVLLHGSTHANSYPDHHTVVKINGQLIEDATWDGQVVHEITAALSNQVLIDGQNTLSFTLPGDTPAGEVDQVFFNWVEISYWRQFRAQGDFIEIPWETNDRVTHQFQISGFSQPEITIIDNRGRRLVNFDIQKIDSSYRVTFQDQPVLAGLRYYVYAPPAIKKVAKLVPDTPSSLASPQNEADYIVITHERFREAAAALVEHRQAQGLRVALVDVQDIYDEFNDGIFDPGAIQKFLQYAYENWHPPAPLYVLLLGDATWAYDKPLARSWGKTYYIPSIMKYTYSWGLTSSDNAFVCVSGGDRLPDMFIGRLPVNSIEEAETVIHKIIQYEKQPVMGDWRKRICLACGDDPFFEQSADNLYRDYIPNSFEVPRLYTNPRSKYFGSTQELVGLFNNGVALLNFIGHGGGGVFFDADLFLLEDISLLKNPHTLPVIFSLTCFIGYFDNPWTPSLGEELLRARDKGCVATFGAAGRAWLYGDYFLNNALFEALFTNNHRHLGQITTQAKWRMIAWTGSYWDHVENYNLLGDPAMAIGLPTHEISLNATPTSVRPGSSLLVRGSLPQALNGQAKISLINNENTLIQEQIAPVAAGRFEAQVSVPPTANAGLAMAKAYFWNETSDGIGAAPLGIEAPAFLEVGTIPSAPGHRDSIFFQAKIDIASDIAPLGIDSAICQFSYTQASWENRHMSRLPNGQYRTQQPIVATEGAKIYYRILTYYRTAANSSSHSMTSQVYSFTVKRRADLRFLAPELLVSGRETVKLQTKILNKGESDARNFTVELFDGDPNIPTNRIGEPLRIAQLAAGRDTSLNFAWPGQPGSRPKLLLRIDAENHVVEFNEGNNDFQKELQFVTYPYGSAGPVASRDSAFAITIAPACVNQNFSLEILARSATEINGSYPFPQGFTLVGPIDSLVRSYCLQPDNPDARILQPFSIRFRWPGARWENLPRIYSWDNEHQHWSHRPAQLDSSSGQLVATAQATDFLFGLFAVTDQTAPKLALRLENQHFASQDYVSSNPIISATIEDESGIDLKTQPPEVHLNEQLVTISDGSLWFSPQSNKMAILRYSPTLSPGEHTITIKAADLAGNWTEQTLLVTVSAEFALQTIANHPNPFGDETIIAYTLTDEAQLVWLRIYTAAGRLIRRLEFSNEVGYIEHVWDGRDETGEEVANGVYYLKFTAQRGSQKIERVEKMAKLK